MLQISRRKIVNTRTHTEPFYCSSGICPGPPGWAGTRKVKPGRLKPIWIYWSKQQWVAVASAGLYASLHLIPDNHANIPPLSFLQAGCPSCRPTNSVKALKTENCKLRRFYNVASKSYLRKSIVILALLLLPLLLHPFNGPLSGTTQVSRYQKGNSIK